MTAFYGFRREEIIGLKWDVLDFERETVTVRHTVTSTRLLKKHRLRHTFTTCDTHARR